MLLIYTSNITSRLEYIADTICTILGIASFELTTDINFYKNTTAWRLNYSATRITDDEIFIQPCGLLNQQEIKRHEIVCFEWKGLKAFYKTEGDIPFDIFSASFYLLSRYEEYLPHQLDEYGRFAHTASLAYRENFLQQPLINLWLQEFKQLLQQKFSSIHFQSPGFKYQPTYDIDIAYSYKGKGWMRNSGAFVKELAGGKWKQIRERVSFYMGFKKDPFDVYDWLNILHKRYQLTLVYFYLMAEEHQQYDKNISPYSDEMIRLVLHNSKKKYAAGIHPSWQSGETMSKLEKEIQCLQQLTGEDIKLSRQHYLRIRFPTTFNLLLANGITNEYSMGYGSINGFRASIANPYYWYDLATESEKQLLMHPFCFMDANACFEQHYTAEQAAKELQNYHDIVKAVNGELITIFHNHFLTEQPQWLPWRKMYEDFLRRNFG